MSVAVIDLVTGLARYPELDTQIRHRLALQKAGYEAKALVHETLHFPRHLHLPPLSKTAKSVTYVSSTQCHLCVRPFKGCILNCSDSWLTAWIAAPFADRIAFGRFAAYKAAAKHKCLSRGQTSSRTTGADTVTRTRWVLILKVVGSVLLLYSVYRIAGSQNLLSSLANANPAFFGLACLFMGVAIALNGPRWRLAVQTLGHHLSIRNAVIGTFESIFFQQILPAGVGGDIARGARAFDSGVPARWAVIGVVIDRANGLLFVAMTLLMAFLVAPPFWLAVPAFRVLVLVSLIVAAGAAFAATVGTLDFLDRLPPWTAPIVALMRGYSVCMKSPRYLAGCLIYLALSTMAYVASFYFCALALGISLGPWDAVAIVQGMVLASIIPISIGGWGLREGAALLLFQPLGVAAPLAIGVSILFGLVISVFAVVGALIWLARGYGKLLVQGNQPDPETFCGDDVPIVRTQNP